MKNRFVKMSMKSISLLLFFSILGCGDQPVPGLIEISGRLQKQEVTFYQYGTHTLETSDTTFALKSNAVDLSQYEGQHVTLQAVRVEGYPLEGGPPLLEVKEIKRK